MRVQVRNLENASRSRRGDLRAVPISFRMIFAANDAGLRAHS